MEPQKAEAFISTALANISYNTDLAASVAQTDLAIEAVVENMALKQKLFAEMENHSPTGALLATNTSSLPISEIAVNLKKPEFFGGLHFFNPVPMMRLLEVIKAEQTSQETFETMVGWGAQMKKTTVRCIDTPGFIVNRLLIPYMLEAVRLYERGHGSKEDIGESF